MKAPMTSDSAPTSASVALVLRALSAASLAWVLAWAGAARADEPMKVGEPRVMSEPGEVTDVVDAFDGDDVFDPRGVAPLVEEGVAGELQGVGQGQRAVRRKVLVDHPALHEFVSVADSPAAGEGRALGQPLA